MAGALIGALRVSLSAETSAFEAGMKRSQRQAAKTASGIEGSFRGIGNALKAGVAGFVSAISIGAVLAAGKAALDYAGSLGEVSQQIGVTTRDLQVFRYAAAQSGVSTEEMDKALQKFTKSLGDARNGSAEAIKTFKAIGFTDEDIAKLDVSQALMKTADGIAAVGDRAARATPETRLFGRAGQQLDPLLSQGSKGMNALAQAAEELGIVLSDEQIRNADETADKLDALKTVLSARIAGVVADNADAILGLANALVELIGKLGTALRAYRAFVAQMEVLGGKLQAYDPTNSSSGQAEGRLRIAAGEMQLRDLRRQQRGGSSMEERAAKFRKGLGIESAPAPKPSGGDFGKFLAGGGRGGGRGRKDRSAEEAQRKLLDNMRAQNQFDQDILNAKRGILQSQLSLAKNADDRANIDLEILAAERREFEAQLAYEVKVFEITKGADGISQAWADQKRELYTINESLQRQAIEQEQHEANLETVARLAEVDYDLQREKLDLEAALAETASEQRDVQLRLLDLWYRQERAQLNAAMAIEAIGSTAWLEAKARRDALDANQGARRANVEAGTRGPLEDYMSELPTTTEKWNEALEGVAARGLQSVEDGLVDILTGTKSVGDALHDMLGQIIQDLIRLGIQRAISMAISGGGMGMGFATGGFVSGPGTATSDSIPAMLSNGEYVVNSRAVGSFGVPFFNGINSGQITPQMLGGAGGGGGGGGFLEGAAGMGLFGAAGLLATGKKLPIFGLAGKLFGFSKGGLVGGLSIPRTRMGERISVSNDNDGRQMRGGDSYSFTFPNVTNAREARQSGMQAANAFRQTVGRSTRVNG